MSKVLRLYDFKIKKESNSFSRLENLVETYTSKPTVIIAANAGSINDCLRGLETFVLYPFHKFHQPQQIVRKSLSGCNKKVHEMDKL